MLATKLSSSLPSAAPIHQVRIVNGQPCSKTGATALTGIVITTPVSATPTRLASPAQAPNPTAITTPILTQPIQISSLTTEPKVRERLSHRAACSVTAAQLTNFYINASVSAQSRSKNKNMNMFVFPTMIEPEKFTSGNSLSPPVA